VCAATDINTFEERNWKDICHSTRLTFALLDRNTKYIKNNKPDLSKKQNIVKVNFKDNWTKCHKHGQQQCLLHCLENNTNELFVILDDWQTK